jgi:expansin (peptidoglycan-binding protein)
MRIFAVLVCATLAACGETKLAPSNGVVGTGSSAAQPPANCSPAPAVTGHATWYSTGGGSGACGIQYAAHQYFGAINEEDFRGSAACGTCVRVTYGGKTLDVFIVDLCPVQGNEQWCGPGGHHIDFGRDAFAYFADPNQGVLKTITWSYVACAVSGGVTYTFKAESSQYWAEILIGNYPYEIAKVEFMDKNGNWALLTRTGYGYYQASGGMGPGPYTIRVTDTNGSIVTDDGVPLTPGGTAQGTANFGSCS